METQHSNPSGRAEIDNKIAADLGHRNNILRRVQPNGYLIRPSRKHHGPPRNPIFPNPLCVSLSLRHPQRHPLGPTLRPLRRPSSQKTHRPPKRLHSAPANRNRARNFDPRDALFGCSGAREAENGEDPQLLRARARSNVGVLANPAVFRNWVRGGFHVRWSIGVFLRTGSGRHEKLVLGAFADYGGAG